MNVIDLTLRLDESMRGVDFETKFTVERDGWNARTLHLYSHCGTHMDAPIHFDAGETTIDQMPLSEMLGRAWRVDLRSLADREPVTVEHLGATAGDIVAGDALLLWTEWSRYAGQPQKYRDDFPPISPELARWIVDRGIRMVGVEPPSVADVNDLPVVTLVHKILLGGNVTIVEGLTNLGSIPESPCTFGAFPLKIANGDGAPCRAFVLA
ncbi:MAG: cyclase family protein [Planctomycetota bacterium]